MIKETTDKAAEMTMQITAIPTQNAVGYIDINNDLSLKNQLLFAKNSECSQLNILLKSAIAHTPKATNPIIIINPVH